MKIYNIIEDDLSVNYLIQVNANEMKALQVATLEAEEILNKLDVTTPPLAALLATQIAHYPMVNLQKDD